MTLRTKCTTNSNTDFNNLVFIKQIINRCIDII